MEDLIWIIFALNFPKKSLKGSNRQLQKEGVLKFPIKAHFLFQCVKRSEMDITNVLPVERISHMISLTAPRDACRLAVVSPVFKSAADSDLVWEKFLPSDHKLIIPNSVSSSSLVTSLSKKVLIFHLYHHPIFINNGTMEKETGRKCYVVGARGYLLSFIEKFVTSNCMQNHTIYYAFFGNTGR
ncbi:hypothetical protein CUMW_125880 [Citrus unshiu]|nr:hypothetical protein CUMW_125880 [Citrus unshiu]